jgi:hypothetical protein
MLNHSTGKFHWKRIPAHASSTPKPDGFNAAFWYSPGPQWKVPQHVGPVCNLKLEQKSPRALPGRPDSGGAEVGLIERHPQGTGKGFPYQRGAATGIIDL